VTERVWVVDKAEYTYEEPVYETHDRTLCGMCGADITEDVSSHGKMHLKNGEDCWYYNKWVDVQVGTKTITVPEVGHYEDKVIKEGYDEQILIKEAGYY
ncbi:MAG: hypothetical protein MJ089_08645, partial [Ruminococcus sp.]|nr:hypothetical protein [Ruminococcus sp.]